MPLARNNKGEIMKSTTVEDTEERMNLVKAKGYTYVELFRMAIDIGLKTDKGEDKETKELEAGIEAIDINVAQEIFQREQWKKTIKDRADAENKERQEKEDAELLIEQLTQRIKGISTGVRGSDPQVRTMMLNALLEITPQKTISKKEYEEFITKGNTHQSEERIKDFLKNKLLKK